jgi:hypothetical protein
VGTTIAPVPGPGETGEQAIFIRFRIGIWPDYFPNVSFPRDAASLEQWWRQQTPNTGPGDTGVITDSVAALFDKIGRAVLVSHSASGVLGWITATKSRNVRAIVSYEPTTFVFPEGEVPPPIGSTAGQAVPLDDFRKLTRIPIQIVYGDNIPSSPHPIFNLEVWRERALMAARFAEAVNRHGGDAEVLHLPDVGVYGNTHFPMSDLNNLEVADLLSKFLHRKRLDRR